MTVSKSRDGVPTWDGSPSTWAEYRRAALLYVQTTKWENRYLCGPRLAAELSGPAKASIANKRASWLSNEQGVDRLLRHLQEVISEPILPEVGNALRSYFRQLRRRKGETMTAFCVRHREEYEKACRALTRMLGSRKSGLRADTLATTSSRRSSWHLLEAEHLPRGTTGTTGLGQHPDNADGDERRPADSSDPGAPLRGSLDGSDPDKASSAEEQEDPWAAWYQQQDGTGWQSSWPRWSWREGWYDDSWRRHGAAPSSHHDNYEEELVDILPDVIQGWLLLEKAGLDSLEKSLIQSDIKSNFSLAGVECALRAHWTDDQVRRRDGTDHSANFEDVDDEEPAEWDDSFFEDWHPQDVAMFQAAQAEEHDAWAQLQTARRTLQDARQKQRDVRLGRRFYPKGKGKGSMSSRPSFGKPAALDVQGPCLRCGKQHATRQCPQRPATTEKESFQTEEYSEFVYHQDVLDEHYHSNEQDFSNEHYHSNDQDFTNGHYPSNVQDFTNGLASDTGREMAFFHGEHVESIPGDGAVFQATVAHKMTTPEAMRSGYGVLDPGATKTMGSIVALEHMRQCSWRQQKCDNVKSINVEDRPTFGFADSEQARCASTVLLQLPVSEQSMKLRVHALDKGSVPVLLSIDTLKRMGAIIDYGRDEAVFTSINPLKRVALQTSATGHQILPLTEDFMEGATLLQAPVRRLGEQTASE